MKQRRWERDRIMRLPAVKTASGRLGVLVWLAFCWLGVAVHAALSHDFIPTAQDKIVPPGAKPKVVWADGEFTEGPVPTADGVVLFSDIGNRIMQYDPRSGKTTVFRAESGRSNGMMFDPQGRLVVCEGANTDGGRRISITETDGRVRTLADRYQGKRFNSPNDLAVDRSGRVYFTDPRYVGDEPRELDFEGVFLIEPNGTVKLATRDVNKPNGILVAADGKTVYVSDNPGGPERKRQLLAFSVRADGTLSDKRVLWQFAPRRRGIDGMTLDCEGNIYAAAGSGEHAGVYVFSPQGKPLARIPLPASPTNCVFGVGRESNVLYITAPAPTKAGRPARFALYRISLRKKGYHLYPPKGP